MSKSFAVRRDAMEWGSSRTIPLRWEAIRILEELPRGPRASVSYRGECRPLGGIVGHNSIEAQTLRVSPLSSVNGYAMLLNMHCVPRPFGR
jgi:hypothetical protein